MFPKRHIFPSGTPALQQQAGLSNLCHSSAVPVTPSIWPTGDGDGFPLHFLVLMTLLVHGKCYFFSLDNIKNMVNHTKRFLKYNLRKEVLTIFSETGFCVEKLLVTDAKIPV